VGVAPAVDPAVDEWPLEGAVVAPDPGSTPDATPPVAPADPPDEEAAGMKRPVRFQKAEKPLNGPPTTWLDHCRVYDPVDTL
jgi:hypothetical protein